MSDSHQVAAKIAAKKAAEQQAAFGNSVLPPAGPASAAALQGAHPGQVPFLKVVTSEGLDGTLVRKQTVQDPAAVQAALHREQQRVLALQKAAAGRQIPGKLKTPWGWNPELDTGSGGEGRASLPALPAVEGDNRELYRRLALSMTQRIPANVSHALCSDPLSRGVAALMGSSFLAASDDATTGSGSIDSNRTSGGGPPVVSPFKDLEKQRAEVASFISGCARGNSGQMLLLVGRHGSGLRTQLGNEMTKVAAGAAASHGKGGPLMRVVRIGGSVAGKSDLELWSLFWRQLRRPLISSGGDDRLYHDSKASTIGETSATTSITGAVAGPSPLSSSSSPAALMGPQDSSPSLEASKLIKEGAQAGMAAAGTSVASKRPQGSRLPPSMASSSATSATAPQSGGSGGGSWSSFLAQHRPTTTTLPQPSTTASSASASSPSSLRDVHQDTAHIGPSHQNQRKKVAPGPFSQKSSSHSSNSSSNKGGAGSGGDSGLPDGGDGEVKDGYETEEADVSAVVLDRQDFGALATMDDIRDDEAVKDGTALPLIERKAASKRNDTFQKRHYHYMEDLSDPPPAERPLPSTARPSQLQAGVDGGGGSNNATVGKAKAGMATATATAAVAGQSQAAAAARTTFAPQTSDGDEEEDDDEDAEALDAWIRSAIIGGGKSSSNNSKSALRGKDDEDEDEMDLPPQGEDSGTSRRVAIGADQSNVGSFRFTEQFLALRRLAACTDTNRKGTPDGSSTQWHDGVLPSSSSLSSSSSSSSSSAMHSASRFASALPPPPPSKRAKRAAGDDKSDDEGNDNTHDAVVPSSKPSTYLAFFDRPPTPAGKVLSSPLYKDIHAGNEANDDVIRAFGEAACRRMAAATAKASSSPGGASEKQQAAAGVGKDDEEAEAAALSLASIGLAAMTTRRRRRYVRHAAEEEDEDDDSEAASDADGHDDDYDFRGHTASALPVRSYLSPRLGLVVSEANGSLSPDTPFHTASPSSSSSLLLPTAATAGYSFNASQAQSKVMALEHLVERAVGVGIDVRSSSNEGSNSNSSSSSSSSSSNSNSPLTGAIATAIAPPLPILVIIEDMDGLVHSKTLTPFLYSLLELRLNSQVPMNIVALSRSYTDLNEVLDRRMRSRITGGNGWTPCFVPQPSPLQLSLRLATLLQMPLMASPPSGTIMSPRLDLAARAYARRFGESLLSSMVSNGSSIGLASHVDASFAFPDDVSTSSGTSIYFHYNMSANKWRNEIITMRNCLQAFLRGGVGGGVRVGGSASTGMTSSSSAVATSSSSASSNKVGDLISALHVLTVSNNERGLQSNAAALLLPPPFAELLHDGSGGYSVAFRRLAANGRVVTASRDRALAVTETSSSSSASSSSSLLSSPPPPPTTALVPSTHRTTTPSDAEGGAPSSDADISTSTAPVPMALSLANDGSEELLSLLPGLPYPHLLLLSAMAKIERRDTHKQDRPRAANAQRRTKTGGGGGAGKGGASTTGGSSSSAATSTAALIDAGINAASFHNDATRLPPVPGISGNVGGSSGGSGGSIGSNYNFTRVYHEVHSAFAEGLTGSAFTTAAAASAAAASSSSSSAAGSAGAGGGAVNPSSTSSSSSSFIPDKDAMVKALEELCYYGFVRLMRVRDGEIAAAVANGIITASAASATATAVGGDGDFAAAVAAAVISSRDSLEAGTIDGTAVASAAVVSSSRMWDGLSLLMPLTTPSVITAGASGAASATTELGPAAIGGPSISAVANAATTTTATFSSSSSGATSAGAGGGGAGATGSSGAAGGSSSSFSSSTSTVLAELEHLPCRLNIDAEALNQFFRGKHAELLYKGLDSRAVGYLKASLGTAPTAM
jgi:hypothetical protein